METTTKKTSSTTTKKATPAKKTPSVKKPTLQASTKGSVRPKFNMVSSEQRHQMICEAAYYLAERRGFQNGNPVEDWVLAEGQIDGLLSDRSSGVA